MKKICFFLLAIMCLTGTACDEKEPKDKDVIASNLLKMGSVDPELLIGEWDCIKFAYTADGKKISNVADISNGKLTISVASTPIDDDGKGWWVLQVVNSSSYVCSIEGNLIELSGGSSTYINVVSPHLEYDLIYAFENAYSFVIKGNELIIYFPKIDDKEKLSHCTVIKNKNLLILKKNNIIDNSCEFENPLTDLPWLKDLINGWKQNGWNSKIYQCTYKDGIGFLLEPCVGCPDAGYSFVNCEGIVLCGGGGLLGKDNCSEFDIDFESKTLIWEINN